MNRTPFRRSPLFYLGACLALGGAGLLSRMSAAENEPRVQFNRDIRPILSENCFQCHGPDAKKRAAKLRLDTREGAVAARKHGPAVLAGQSGKSSLIQRIQATDEERMPPPETGKKLTARQIELLQKWIDQGAEYQQHWSFIRPQRPALPEVKDAALVRNPIDRFVLARLEAEGLKPAAPADKRTLLRRVAFDLTGLPPTPQEIDAFLADNSPDAYEKVVERLLASPRYGENMARYWLDLARYGDTHGLHFDNERALWKYREWVINAFNANKRFDQFTVEQVAGDLLPNATLEQKIASGFNRCNVTSNEGGSINEELLMRYAVDRTETMSTVFLGLTLGCAVCHDHKFDPVTQKEFYQLYAFYNSAADSAMDGNTLAPAPVLKIATPEQEKRGKELDAQVAAVRKKIADTLASLGPVDDGPATPANANEPREFVWIDDAAPAGAKLQGEAQAWKFVSAPEHPVFSGKKSMRNAVPGLGQFFFDSANPGLTIGEGDKLFAYVWLDPKAPPKAIMLQFNDGSWEHRAFWGEDLIPWGTSGSVSRQAMGPLPKSGEWVRLEVETAKVGLASGALVKGMAFTQHGGTAYWDKAGIVTKTPQNGQTFASQAEWEAFERGQKKSKIPPPVRDALKIKADKRNETHKKLIRDYYLENVSAKTKPLFEPLRQELAAVEKERKALETAIPMTMVMADLPSPRQTHVMIRGQYDKKGEQVFPGVPASLPPMPKDAPPNRLGLARWLTDPAHPLTPRVAVNRFWQQYFGRGLVKTAEDFGTQGEWPTHPELLDWLAVEFIESGWNVKHIQRLIVTSAAYRQTSDLTPELLKRDPENALLARGPRYRLDGEVVRDTALFVSGLLTEQIGGRSVKTYQPPGIWEAIGFNGSNTRDFKRDGGTALYRRSLYTFWKRTAPPPGLMAFDAPTRETCVARRGRTNTPLQALVLLNDDQYVEAARNLAQRMMTDGGPAPTERLAYGFLIATGRKPNEAEAKVLSRVYEKQRERFAQNKPAAEKLLSVGESKRNDKLDAVELAAYTMAANLILNLDETITKE